MKLAHGRVIVILLLVGCAALVFDLPSAQAQNDRLYARIILFIPENTRPPQGYDVRLNSVGTRAEAFFGEWLEHWGREVERTEFFVRNEDGNIQVTLVKGKLKDPKSNQVLEDLRSQAIQGAKSQLGIGQRTKVLWWIFHAYPGAKGYVGGGNTSYGSAINEYPPGKGAINQRLDLASRKMADLKIKGMIHEFGHALGLPHNGPRPDLRLGNSLMGPINRFFAAKNNSNDTRVYLNESSAAMLWKHPIFRRQTPPKPVMPSLVNVTGLSATEQPNGMLKVQGMLKSNQKAHTAVLFDSGNNKFGDYWSRSYVGEIENEKFEIVVQDPFDEGTLLLSFCFNNGINTADGRSQFSRKSVIEIPYRGRKGNRKFELPN